MEWKELQIDKSPQDILDMLNLIGDNPKVDIDVRYHTSQVYFYIKDLLRKPEPEQPTHEEILQRVKRELNIQIDTKIADMKKTIIRHMNDLYDSIVPPEETS